jgi:nitrite reductase/ring-hydroxylating ferredoxin subunit
LDLTLAFFFVCNNKLLLSLNTLRLVRLVAAFSNLHAGRLMKETIAIFKKTVMMNLSIIGSMIVCLMFFAVLAHSILVRLFDQGEEATSNRCRFIGPYGSYKIDDSQNFLCRSSGSEYTCPTGEVCLSNLDSELLLKGTSI